MSTLPHDAALLLPWYVNGTLTDEQRDAVAAHLQECSACRSELESTRAIRHQARAAFASSPPPPRLHKDVMLRVKTRRPRHLRTLLQSLAAMVILQTGALVWFALNSVSEPQVTTRGVETAATRVLIVFNPLATEGEIRSALTALGGRIVDGPSEEGAYTVELPQVPPTVLSQRLRELRERPGLVERIENAAP